MVPASRGAEQPRVSRAEEALGAALQPLDQAVGTARCDNRGKFIASGREITDRAIEIDVDHSSAADQVVNSHDSPARLHQLRFYDLASAARFRSGLRIDDEAFPRVILDLGCIIRDDESCEGLLGCGLLCR